MGNRLSKIYTRTGDDGSTGMADGSRVSKDSTVIKVVGEVDELNAFIAGILVKPLPDKIRETLLKIQHHLFDIGGELSYPAYSKIDADKVKWLEDTMDTFNEQLPPLKEFILPGGGEAAVACHIARAVSRRVERSLVSWKLENDALNPQLLIYINRLSDLLFVFCRSIAAAAGEPETMWRSEQ